MHKRKINTELPATWGGLDEALNHFRFSRTSLYKLLKEADGEIEHAMVCGRRLINLVTLSAYLSKLSREQVAEAHHQSTRESLEAICEG
jgi:hypothetical protein